MPTNSDKWKDSLESGVGKTGSKFYVLRVPRTSFLVAGTFLIQNIPLTPFLCHLLLQYFDYLHDNFVELICFQMTYSIQDDAHIGGKDAVRANIAPLL